ncbi:oxygen-dependent coproporphyrinogen oxidase [Lishizhenia sp.]|uniref:oxygen-dependent coproporphyrinogen oxidase n=1 Tax=Lishizhenia sp. TaxID=2497594 RepID=UPI00299D2721|nr:oxygen-dependent coproporphyrinogen oxidase [Lishizhenia sp.]MDX1445614.1 oxygen-dependent coproporphyrinogen oxidase [Lishizhenia sp.]
MEKSLTKEYIKEQFKLLQDRICSRLEELDGKSKFHQDLWERAEGGGGRTRIIQDGNVLEKGGVNFSAVHGPVSEMMKKQLKLDGKEFFATGVSIVLHPHNPHVPIMHMNVRYFEMDNGVHWFGGGIDMTPHYVIPEQAAMFHQGLKDICDRYNPNFYPDYKKWADEYFYIPHREETRGVGGIFYDHIKTNSEEEKQSMLDFAIDLGDAFAALYKEQNDLGKDKEVLPEHEQWRNIRRGRYVEFNLVHDRGTAFGLKTGGRIESILMSLPKIAGWEYDFKVEENSQEAKTLSLLKKDLDWIIKS